MVTRPNAGGLSTRLAWRAVSDFWRRWSRLMLEDGHSPEFVALAARVCETENYAGRTRQVALRVAGEVESAALADDLILSLN
jgi:hypothetical protein